MDTLQCSIAEAKEIIEYDKQVDKARVKDRLEHDLPIEVEKQAKKMCNVKEHAKKPTAYKWDTRERKKDTTKEGIIKELQSFLESHGYADVEIINPTKEIGITIDGVPFSVTLVRHTKKAKKAE